MSANQEKEEDINEAFEKLLFAEEIAEEIGYTEGYEAGRNQKLKGYHLGYHRASLLAARLGYYYGVVEYCLTNGSFGERVIQQALKLREAIKTFPRNNDTSFDILQTVEDIKFKYTKLCSMAKLDSSYPEADNLDY